MRADFAASCAVLRAACDLDKVGISGPLGALERLQVGRAAPRVDESLCSGFWVVTLC